MAPLPDGPQLNIKPGIGIWFTNSLMVSPRSVRRAKFWYWPSVAFSISTGTLGFAPGDEETASPGRPEPVPIFIFSAFCSKPIISEPMPGENRSDLTLQYALAHSGAASTDF